MNSTNKLIKIASMIYLILSILVIQYINIYGGILLFLGISLLSYSFLSIEELKKKKTMIIIIAITSLFFNFVSAILLFVAYNDISTSKFENNIPPPEDEISSESKRIDILLKIGLGMILASGILFATTSWETLPDIVKCISLTFMGVLFLGLSKFSETKIKIEKTAKAYYIIGLVFFLLSFIGIGMFGTFSKWFSYTGEGKNLVYFFTFILLSTILFIIDYKFKQKEYKYIGYICSYLSIYHILMFIGLNLELTTLVLSTIIFLTNILLNDKNNTPIKDISKEISYIFWPILIIQETSDLSVIVVVSSVINIINIIYLTLKTKESFYNIIYVIINYILIINIAFRLQTDNTNIILFIISTIFYLLVSHNKTNTSIHRKNTNQIVYNILTTITLISITDSSLKVFICSIIYGLVNFINCYITNKKDSIFDLYYQPMVLIIVVASIFHILGDLINIDSIYESITVAIIFALIHYIVKNIKVKNIYFIALIIMTILTALTNNLSCNIIVGILIVLLSVYIYKEKTKSLSYIFILLSILLLKNAIIDTTIIKCEISPIIANIVTIIIYGGLTYLYKNNYTLKRINLFAIILPMYSMTYAINIQENIRSILLNILALYILFLIVLLFIKSQKAKDVIATIFTSLILLGIMQEGDLLIGLYIGIVGIAIIFITHNKRNYKALFYCGVIITIINLLIQLGAYWEQIPLWLYLLLVGGAIIAFVTNKELKKQIETPKESNEEIKIIVKEEKENNISVQTDNFCKSCGNKNDGSKFCKKCGKSLIKKDFK